MYVSIETLTVSFVSLGFKATANISRVIVQSTTPEWRQSNNLRETRIKDEEKDEVINFKEIKWGTMRVHVDAAYKAEVCSYTYVSFDTLNGCLFHTRILFINAVNVFNFPTSKSKNVHTAIVTHEHIKCTF